MKHSQLLDSIRRAREIELARKYSFRAVIARMPERPVSIGRTLEEQVAVLAAPSGVSGETIRYAGEGRYMVERTCREVPVFIHHWVGQKDFSVLVANPSGCEPWTKSIPIESVLEIDEHYYQITFKNGRPAMKVYGRFTTWLQRI